MNEADDDNGEDHTEQPVQKKIKKGQVPPPLTKKANDVVNVVDDDAEAKDVEQEDNNVDDGDKEDNALVGNDKKVSSEFPSKKKNQFVMSRQEERVANRYILMELL
jgi:hypothetical protein